MFDVLAKSFKAMGMRYLSDVGPISMRCWRQYFGIYPMSDRSQSSTDDSISVSIRRWTDLNALLTTLYRYLSDVGPISMRCWRQYLGIYPTSDRSQCAADDSISVSIRCRTDLKALLTTVSRYLSDVGPISMRCWRQYLGIYPTSDRSQCAADDSISVSIRRRTDLKALLTTVSRYLSDVGSISKRCWRQYLGIYPMSDRSQSAADDSISVSIRRRTDLKALLTTVSRYLSDVGPISKRCWRQYLGIYPMSDRSQSAADDSISVSIRCWTDLKALLTTVSRYLSDVGSISKRCWRQYLGIYPMLDRSQSAADDSISVSIRCRIDLKALLTTVSRYLSDVGPISKRCWRQYLGIYPMLDRSQSAADDSISVSIRCRTDLKALLTTVSRYLSDVGSISMRCWRQYLGIYPMSDRSQSAADDSISVSIRCRIDLNALLTTVSRYLSDVGPISKRCWRQYLGIYPMSDRSQSAADDSISVSIRCWTDLKALLTTVSRYLSDVGSISKRCWRQYLGIYPMLDRSQSAADDSISVSIRCRIDLKALLTTVSRYLSDVGPISKRCWRQYLGIYPMLDRSQSAADDSISVSIRCRTDLKALLTTVSRYLSDVGPISKRCWRQYLGIYPMSDRSQSAADDSISVSIRCRTDLKALLTTVSRYLSDVGPISKRCWRQYLGIYPMSDRSQSAADDSISVSIRCRTDLKALLTTVSRYLSDVGPISKRCWRQYLGIYPTSDRSQSAADDSISIRSKCAADKNILIRRRSRYSKFIFKFKGLPEGYIWGLTNIQNSKINVEIFNSIFTSRWSATKLAPVHQLAKLFYVRSWGHLKDIPHLRSGWRRYNVTRLYSR